MTCKYCGSRNFNKYPPRDDGTTEIYCFECHRIDYASTEEITMEQEQPDLFGWSKYNDLEIQQVSELASHPGFYLLTKMLKQRELTMLQDMRKKFVPGIPNETVGQQMIEFNGFCDGHNDAVKVVNAAVKHNEVRKKKKV
jgi:hypothetical protein